MCNSLETEIASVMAYFHVILKKLIPDKVLGAVIEGYKKNKSCMPEGNETIGNISIF